MSRVFGVTGWKNSGKTTLMAALVAEFTRRKFVISTIKHASESFQLDTPGTDTHAHRDAGAKEVTVVSDTKWAIMHQTTAAGEVPTLETMLRKMAPCDLVLVEGFKASSIPKIECIRDATGNDPIWKNNTSVVALASVGEVEDCDLPVFDPNEIGRIADYIAQTSGLGL